MWEQTSTGHQASLQNTNPILFSMIVFYTFRGKTEMERAPTGDRSRCRQLWHQCFLCWTQRSSFSAPSVWAQAPCLLGWVAARGPAANTHSVQDSLLPSLSLSAGSCWCWDWGMLPPFSSSSRFWLTAQTDIPACSNGTVLSCLNTTAFVMLCDRCHLVAWFYFFNDNLPWLSLFCFMLLFKLVTLRQSPWIHLPKPQSTSQMHTYLPRHLCIDWRVPVCQAPSMLEVRESKGDGVSCRDRHLWPQVSGSKSFISVG